MKIRVTKFLENAAGILAGSISSFVFITIARNYDLVQPSDGLSYLGVCFLGAMIGTIPTRMYLSDVKEEQELKSLKEEKASKQIETIDFFQKEFAQGETSSKTSNKRNYWC